MSLLTAWYITRLLWIAAALCILHVYLRTWFPPAAALAGVGVVAATLPLTFTNSWPHPDHMPELALFTAGALAIARRKDVLFAIVLALAAFNRETSVFLVMLYAVAEPLTPARLARTAAFGFEWLSIYGGLRYVRGLQHYDYWQAARNIADLKVPLPAQLYDPYYRLYAYFGLVLFGPMLVVALRSLRDAPPFARRALIVAPFVVLVAFLFSNIIESRIFTPLYPLVLPAAIAAIVEGTPESRETLPPGRGV